MSKIPVPPTLINSPNDGASQGGNRDQLVSGFRLGGLLISFALLLIVQLDQAISLVTLILRIVLVATVCIELVIDVIRNPWRLSWLRRNGLSILAVVLFGIYFVFIYRLPGWYAEYGRRMPAVGLILIRNFFLYFRVGPFFRKISTFLQSISMHPARTLTISFQIIILIGTVLLMLPFATIDGEGLGFVDALFTATSAVCVTGLIVVDTALHFTLAGKVIILVLIQIGGLGIMILSYSASWVITRKLSLQDKLMLSFMTNETDLNQVSRSLLRIVGVTILVEAIGAIVLMFGFLREGFAPLRALWYGVFHSISAFCNAGFALFSNSFESYQSSVLLNMGLSALILLGGISFAVVLNLHGFTLHRLRNRLRPRSERIKRLYTPGLIPENAKLSLNTKVVLSVSGMFILLSTLLIYFTEHGNSLSAEPVGTQYLSSFFQAVTLRTAGFNTVNFADFSTAAIMICILFMIVGGASGSTAGGIKVNTFAVVYAYLRSRFKGQNRVLLFNYALTRNTASNALVLFIFAVFAVLLGLIMLLFTERADFTDVLFETVSAFGTVGVSRGLTADLSVPGRFIIIVLMFMGRIGPLTLLTALADREVDSDVIYPEKELLIG